jgi:hypothetical protein
MRRRESRQKPKPATKTANKRPVSRASERAPERPLRVRKNMNMDQAKLDAARRLFGARTESEAVDAALDLAAFQAEVAAAIDKMVKARSGAKMFGD